MMESKKFGILLILMLLLSSCGVSGYYGNPPARRGKVIVVKDQRRGHPRNRYEQRRNRLSSSEFSRLYYQLKVSSSDHQRRKVIRNLPNRIVLTRRQCADILYLERSEKQAYRIYKELIPHIMNRRDAEMLADTFRSRSYREKAFRLAQRVPPHNAPYGYPHRR